MGILLFKDFVNYLFFANVIQYKSSIGRPLIWIPEYAGLGSFLWNEVFSIRWYWLKDKQYRDQPAKSISTDTWGMSYVLDGKQKDFAAYVTPHMDIDGTKIGWHRGI